MADTDDIKAEIEQTRRELADTVGAISEKLNPKVQTRKHARELAEQLEQRRAAAVAAGVVLLLLMIRRRRRRRRLRATG